VLTARWRGTMIRSQDAAPIGGLMTARRSLLLIALACPIIAFAARTLGAAPQTTAQPDALPALLAEVHELRLAMERSATVAPRVQLTLARLNIQEQRTVVLSRQLDQIRQEQANALLETKKLSSELEDVQKALQTTLDASQRSGLEFEEQGLKRKLGQQAAIEDRCAGARSTRHNF